MLVEQRRDRLLELVRVGRFASLPELAEQLAVSESTVRRDLDQLEEQGVARRIHGGVLYAGASPKLPHFDAQQPAEWEKKRLIAVAAVQLIEDGDTILLDGGSTTYEVARLLVGRPLHVVTTSLPVANLFASDNNSDLVFIGGNICPRSGVARGPYADRMLSMVRVRKTIFSVAADLRRGLLQQRPAVGRDGAGDDAGGRRGDRRGRQHQVRPPEPYPPVCARRRATPGGRQRHYAKRWRAKLEAAGVDLTVAGAEEDNE